MTNSESALINMCLAPRFNHVSKPTIKAAYFASLLEHKGLILKRRIDRHQNFNNGRKSQDDSQVLRCYKCNQIGHIKANCPSNEEWPEKSEKKRFDERRTKKAYIAWDDNDSSDGSEKEINLLTKDYESDENISHQKQGEKA